MQKLKFGDWIKIISGKYKNKVVKIKSISIKKRKIIFDPLNIQVKNNTKNFYKIDISNVMYFSPAYNIASKVGFIKLDSKTKQRFLKKNAYILKK